jgi:drug/metabolite transporter (DMT)-like permease
MSGKTHPLADGGAILFCTIAWSTTWYAITLQFGVVDPAHSVVYRFALAGALLFGWCKFRGERLALTREQHVAAAGLGIFTFSLNYALVYWAEERVSSAVVAVIFAALAFVNLVVFRIAFRQRARAGAWIASLLGVSGIVFLSWGELAQSARDPGVMTGIAMTVAAVVSAAIGNIFAHRSDTTGASVAASTAWAMAYGAVFLGLYALSTGEPWRFDARPTYVLSLLYLAVVGSVIAFLLYYGLARRRGYTLASYISALTPPIAMLISTVLEGKTWTAWAFAGIALVLAGQWLLLASRKDPN